MADIQFRVDAVLGDTTQLREQINGLNANIDLTINSDAASQAIQNLQRQVDNLRQGMQGLNLGANGSVMGITENIEAVPTKINKIFGAINSSDIAKRMGIDSYGDLDTIVQNLGNSMSKVTTESIKVDSATGQIKSAIISYKDEIGNTVQETLRWKTVSEKTVDGTLVKTQKLTSDTLSYKHTVDNAVTALDRLGVTTGDTLNMGGVTDINSLQAALSKSNIAWTNNISSIRGFSQSVDSAGNTITKFTVRQEKLGADGKQYWQDTSYAVSDVDNKVRQLSQHQSEMNKANTQSLVQQIKMQFKQYAIYYAVSTVIQTIAQTFSDCINYVKDLDEAMTNIRIVTMDTKEATEDLLETYNEIGQKFGASTTDVAEGAVDWLRQGYSVEDTNTLVTDSTILSKLALIDTAEATEYLTSALKGYKLEASDAIGVIDQLVSIDLKAATSSADMAEALSRTANMARTTGFEMNEVLGVIATMSEVTQNSAGVVGNSVKTMLSRMSNVAAGKDVDDEGESINDVEKTLNRIGIALRTSENEWRDYYEVLDEISQKWDTLTDVDKSQVTTALGGTRQRENVLVILENWEKVKEYAAIGAEASGAAMEKYDIVLESVATKQAQLTAKTEEFYSNVLNSGFIKGLLEIGKFLMDFMNLGDGLVGKVILLTSAFALLNTILVSSSLAGLRGIFVSLGRSIKDVITAIPNLITGLRAATTAQEGLNAAQRANVWIAIAELVVLATWAIVGFAKAQKEAMQESIDKAHELTEAYKESRDEFKESMSTLTESTTLDSNGDKKYSSLQEEFDKLTQGVDRFGNNLSLSNAEYDRYKEICKQIVDLNPDLMDGYDNEIEAIGNKNDRLSKTIELLETQARLEAQKYADGSDDLLKGYQNTYKQTIKEIKKGSNYNTKTNYEKGWTAENRSLTNDITKWIGDLEGAIITRYFTDSKGDNVFYTIFDKELKDVVSNWDSTYKPQFDKIKDDFLAYAEEINEGDYAGVEDIDTEEFEKYYNAYIKNMEDAYINAGYLDAVNGYNAEVQAAKDELAHSMDEVYKSVLAGSEAYGKLDTDTQKFLNEWATKNFTIDKNTTSKTIDANKKAIEEMISNIASGKASTYNSGLEMNDGTPAVGQQLFTKLFEIDEDANTLTVAEYRKQIQEVLKHIVAMINGIDIKDVTEKQIVEMGDIFGFKMVTDGKKGIPWDESDLEDALKEASETLRKEVNAKIASGKYTQKDVEIIIGLKPKIKGDLTEQGLDALINISKFSSVEYDDVFAEYVEDINGLSTAMETFTKAQEEYNEKGAITASTMKKIIDEDLLGYIEVVDGKLTFNTEKLQENNEQIKENAKQQLQCALFTDLNRIALGEYNNADINNDGKIDELDKQTSAFLKVAGSASTATEAIKGYAEATGVDTSGWTTTQNDKAEEAFNKYKNMVAKIDAITVSSSSSSSSSKKSATETAFDNLKKQFEADEISIDTYISQMEVLLKKVKKGTDEYEKIKKELNAQKLNQIENQFDRGEITISQYIAKLEALRNTYNKNSEGYKELTQTINETKADKFADEYERGQISLSQYIARLTELRNAYKTNSEEWKKFNDLIRETALDEFLKGLEESVDEIERAINKLGEINTNKEQADYAGLLVKQYKQVQSNISAIQTKLKDVNLISKEREELQEKLNDLLEKEVDIRDEIEDSVRTYYENQKEQAEQQAELHKKQLLYQKELELYGNQGKELYEYYANQEIDALQAIIDKKEEEREAQDKLNEREELQNNLLEARIKLQEALNNKTTKILKKQADGTWQYEYSSNMVDVKSAQDAVKDAEKALEDFDYEQSIDELQGKIDELQGAMDNLADQYEDAEFWADREYEQTMNAISEVYGDIDALVEKWMASYNKDTKTLTDAYVKLTDSNIKLEDAILKLEKAIESQYETVGKKNNVNAKNGVTSFDTGGTIQGNGLAFVHDKERVLTASQNVYFEQLISKLPELLKLVDVTKISSGISGYAANLRNNTEKTLSTVISKVECIFPNITTTEGLQKAILELPRLALQQK